MPGKFNGLIIRVKKGDTEAILSLKRNIETVVLQYLSKNNLEINWLASKGGLFSASNFFEQLYTNLLSEITNESSSIESFIKYKKFITEKSIDESRPLFQEFYTLLKNNNHNCWQIFDKLLKIRVKCWLIKKGIKDELLIDSLYQDAQTIFIKKMAKKELSFDDSRLLKSYIFKIINLKLFEHNRKNNTAQLHDNQETGLINMCASDQYLSKMDKHEINNKLLSNLDDREKIILKEVFFNGEKLKNIALKLNITEVNCRLIKHRALVKLEGPARNLGYP